MPRSETAFYRALLRRLRKTMTADQVIVNQAGRLHEGVADGGAYKAKAAFQQVFA
jgi:hypothetical protein